MLLQSFACLNLALPVLDFSHMGLSMPPQSYYYAESAALLFGCSRLGASTSVLEHAHLEPSLSLRSFGHFEFMTSILDFLHLGPLTTIEIFGMRWFHVTCVWLDTSWLRVLAISDRCCNF